MTDYFPHLSDEEVEKRIGRLAPNQKKIFEEKSNSIYSNFTRRHALFIALSWPLED